MEVSFIGLVTMALAIVNIMWSVHYMFDEDCRGVALSSAAGWTIALLFEFLWFVH